MKYDGSILEKHAKILLTKAANIVAGYAFSGVLIGLATFAAVFNSLKDQGSGLIAGAIAGSAIIALLVKIGLNRALALKVQAHMALALVEIEINTRKKP